MHDWAAATTPVRKFRKSAKTAAGFDPMVKIRTSQAESDAFQAVFSSARAGLRTEEADVPQAVAGNGLYEYTIV
jgi:hypothetical protein